MTSVKFHAWRLTQYAVVLHTDVDVAWLRNPAAASGPRLVPRSTRVEHDCGGASDHQPVVVDFEAVPCGATE